MLLRVIGVSCERILSLTCARKQIVSLCGDEYLPSLPFTVKGVHQNEFV